MAFSTQRAVSDGTLTFLDVSIEYLDRSEISVFLNDAPYPAWAWLGSVDKRILFATPIPVGGQVLIRRTTDKATLRHSFNGGAAFTTQSLDEALSQTLHVAQEAAEGNLATDFFNDLDMHGRRMKNIGNAVAPGDAVPLSQLNDAAAAGAIASLTKVLRADTPMTALPAQRSGRVLSFDSNGNPLLAIPVEGTATALAAALVAGGGAQQVSWLPPEAGALLTSLEDQLKQTCIRPERFMSPAQKMAAFLRTANVDHTAAFQAALNTGLPVEANGHYLADGLINVGSHVFGTGVIQNRPNSTSRAIYEMTGGSLVGMTFKSVLPKADMYGVLMFGANPLLERTRFQGNYGHAVYASGASNVRIHTVTVERGIFNIVMVLEAVEGFNVQGCNIPDHTGFGIQARFSGKGTIQGNLVGQPYFVNNFTANAASQTFTVDNAHAASRFSAYCDGAFRTVGAVVQNGTSYSVPVTGLVAGKAVAIYSFVGLENIQVNSGCYDVGVFNNTCGSSGDSCIVVGADYHNTAAPGATPNWVLNAGAVVPADYPGMVHVNNNVCRGPALAAGIAFNNVVGYEAIGNILENVGYTNLEAFKFGITLGLATQGTVHTNTANGSNGHMLACVKFVGELVNSAKTVIGRNKGIGCKGFEGFPNRGPAEKSFGYIVQGAAENSRITRAIEALLDSSWTGGEQSLPLISLAKSGGTGLTKTQGFGYGLGFRTIPNEYMNIAIQPAGLGLFKDKFVRVRFWAKALTSGASGYAHLYYVFPTNADGSATATPPPVQQTIDSTTEQEFSFEMNLGRVTALFLRIGGINANVEVTDLRIDALDIEK